MECQAQSGAVVVVARAAFEPANSSVPWTTIPVFVQVARPPDSKSSVKTGIPDPLGVVALAGSLGGEEFPARSRAWIVYVYAVEGTAVVSAYEVDEPGTEHRNWLFRVRS